MMKYIALFIFLGSAGLVRADLSLVQKVEGISPANAAGINEITIKMKGTKARIETGAKASTIVDASTGEMITLMHDRKAVLRISGERAKAMAEMANKYAGKNEDKTKPELVPTGKMETVNGMDTEIYTTKGGTRPVTYWIAKNYPNAAAILKQMQAMLPKQWTMTQGGMPDYRDFPGLPVKTEFDMGGKKVTTTLVSVKEDPISDAEFTIPADYSELKIPGLEPAKAAASPTP
ncbi:MAG: DUF4412 domain-containing protein [Verrucomicrobiota bacterium]|nr:DUF4412 domain-containing protein [Verrucomicrobiota bacterium]